jgi:N-formylmaleamate deformylase
MSPRFGVGHVTARWHARGKVRTMRALVAVMIVAACGATPEPKHASSDDDSDGEGPFVATKGYKPHTFHDEITGEGRPVIFIPGLGCPGEMFDPIVKHLDGKVEAHVLTLAGFAGQKPTKPPLAAAVRKDLIRYIRSLRLESPIIVGHSLGGFIAYWVAATAPDLIGGVVVIDEGPALAGDNDAETAHTLRNMWAQAGDDDIADQVRIAYSSMVTDPKKIEPYLEQIARSDRHTIGDAIYELVKTDLRDQMKNITAPFLLVLADGGLQNAYKVMVKPIEHKKIVVLPKTRHFVWLDDPDAFDAVLDTFLKDHP